LVDLHRKSIQNGWQNRVAGESKSTIEEVMKDDNFPILGVGICSSRGARPAPEGIRPSRIHESC
jgi:hypothetical protein